MKGTVREGFRFLAFLRLTLSFLKPLMDRVGFRVLASFDNYRFFHTSNGSCGSYPGTPRLLAESALTKRINKAVITLLVKVVLNTRKRHYGPTDRLSK